MSETDDTDVLLLIPPNFFSVHSSGSEDSLLDSSRTVVHKPSCTAQVLGKLVNQVHSLENRLENLELTSDSVSSYCGRSRHKTWDFSASVDSVSVTKFSTFPRRRRRKTASQRDRRKDLSLTSLDSLSSYSKIIPPLILNHKTAADDISTMDGDLSSIVSTPSKKNDKLLLNEIDEFLTKVESYELPEGKLKSAETSLNPENVIKATRDYISQKMDSRSSTDDIRLPSGRYVSSSVLDKYIYMVKNNAASQADKPSTSYYRSYPTDTSSKQQDETPKNRHDTLNTGQDTKSPSIRRLNFNESKDIQPTSTPKRTEIGNLSTFRPSSYKTYERATKKLDQFKQDFTNVQNSSIDTSYLNSPKKEEFKVPLNPKPYQDKEKLHSSMLQSNKFIDTIDTELLSLSDLWGDKREEKVDSLRLEEEKMKREHCELLIQDLQKKLLEQQERLAVAIKVDRSKDVAITKLRDAWVRLTNGLERTEERHKAEIETLRQEMDNMKEAADEGKKKAQHFEAELYKALDLAHDYQEKCKHLNIESEQTKQNTEKLIKDKDEVISVKEKEIDVLRENYDTVMRLNKQSTDCVKNVEETLEKERKEHDQTKQKLHDFARQLRSNQEECDVTRCERDSLIAQLAEERARWSETQKLLADKQNQCSELLRRCDTLETEARHHKSQIEQQRQSLRQHYQSQLENALAVKLAELQEQLEAFEKKGECVRREEITARERQHQLEIKVLEEKHKEEAKLYRLQLAQASEKIGLLESKLSSHRARRSQLAEQLHSVMEAQWRQALHILTGTDRDLIHTRSDIASTPEPCEPKAPWLSLPPLGARGPLDQGGLGALSDAELQHYVRRYLTKPANILDGSGDSTAMATAEAPTSDHEKTDTTDKRDKARRNGTVNKPPWKS